MLKNELDDDKDVGRRRTKVDKEYRSDEHLYEGNFEEWDVSMRRILCSHGLELDQHTTLSEQQSAKAANIVASHVTYDVMRRVPAADRTRVETLITTLRECAKPFRLMDLPPELRREIYASCLSLGSVRYIFFGHNRNSIQSAPALCAVSRQIRHEALAVYYDHNIFWFDYCGTIPKHEANCAVANILRWSKGPAQAHVKHLRRVGLACRIKPGVYTNVQFSYSPDGGVAVKYVTRLDECSKKLLDKHIETVEAEGRAQGLAGEALILALVSKPELWAMGILRYE